MASKLEVNYRKAFTTKKSAQETFQYLTNYHELITKNFPGLESFVEKGPNTYEWAFKKLEYKDIKVQVKAVTKFEAKASSEIAVIPVPQKGYANASGKWTITPQGNETQAEYQTKLEMELELPFLVRAIAGPIAQSELTKIFDRYLQNVQQALNS